MLNLGSDLTGGFDIHQRTFVHARAVFRCLAAFSGVGKQLRPKGEGAALERLHRVHRAAVGAKEWTLFFALLTKAQQGWDTAECAAKIAPFEFRSGDPKMLGEACNIVGSHINRPLLLAATNASGLALEAHARVYREVATTHGQKALIQRVEFHGIESKQSRIFQGD